MIPESQVRSRLGVNVTFDGGPTPAVADTGCGLVRLALRRQEPITQIIDRYAAHQIAVLPCIDSLTSAQFSSEHAAAAHFSSRLAQKVFAVQIGLNEFETVGDTSSTASIEDVRRRMLIWADALLTKDPTLILVGPGLASGVPSKWPKILDDVIDAIAPHPYVKDRWTAPPLLNG